MAPGFRKEKDLLGEMEIPADVLWGIHSARARENFDLPSKRRVNPGLIHANDQVKLACVLANNAPGFSNAGLKKKIVACKEEEDR